MESKCPKCGAAWRHRLHETDMTGTVDYWQCDSYRRNVYGDEIQHSMRCKLAAANSEVERLRERDQKWQLEAFTALTAAEEEHSDEVISVVKTMLFRMGIEEPPCLT